MVVVIYCMLFVAFIFALVCITIIMAQHTADSGNIRPFGNDLAGGMQPASTTRDLVISANGIRLVLARRLAGGVWSMTWNKHEFVSPEMGNGGSQQSALSLDIPVGRSSEEENPTEAGMAGYHGGGSTSQWIEARTNATGAYTRSKMGYYIKPGDPVGGTPGIARTVARGKGPLSPVTLAKRVDIGYKGFPNVVNYTLQFTIPTVHWFIQFEILTGYMPRDFNMLYYFDGTNAVPVNAAMYRPQAGQQHRHVIVAKSRECALGVVCHTWPKNGRFKFPWYKIDAMNPSGHLPWDKGQFPAGTSSKLTKWNVVWHAGAQDKPGDKRHTGTYTFGVALVLGTLDQVVATLRRLS
jgi:hypothetical protein